MKIILHDVIAIESIFSKLTTKHFPDFKKALKIAKVAKELATIKQSFSDQERMILASYMKADENGNFVVEDGHLVPKDTKPETITKLNKELNDLHGSEVELETLSEPLVFDDERGLEDITPQDILALEGLVEFKFEEDNSSNPAA